MKLIQWIEIQDVKFSNGVAHVIDTVLFPPTNVSATAQALQLDELVNALIEADLVETVDALSEVTIFAPTNEAFEAVNPKPTKEQLTNILT